MRPLFCLFQPVFLSMLFPIFPSLFLSPWFSPYFNPPSFSSFLFIHCLSSFIIFPPVVFHLLLAPLPPLVKPLVIPLYSSYLLHFLHFLTLLRPSIVSLSPSQNTYISLFKMPISLSSKCLYLCPYNAYISVLIMPLSLSL